MRISALIFLVAHFSITAGLYAQPQSEVKSTAKPALPYRIEWNVEIPMRDGITLDATLFRPISDKLVPVVVTLTPYVADRFEDVGAYFAQHGYAFACIDDRGRGNSGGSFVLWQGEGRDGHDAIEWLTQQPWSDGHAATWGGSYGGKNQWMIAGEAPRGLSTIVPASAGVAGQNIGMHTSNIFLGYEESWLLSMMGHTANTNSQGDALYWKGLYLEASRGNIPFRDFDKLAGYPNAAWQEWMQHPTFDAFWDAASTAPDRYSHITIPTLSITGQFDGAETGTIEFRQHHLDAVPPSIAAGSYLLIGPWNHAGSRIPMSSLGGLDFGSAALIDVKALHVAWFDHVIKGTPLPALLKDHFTYYLLGSNVWRSAPTVAAATDHVETVMLSSPASTAASIAARGTLVPSAPVQPPDHYLYDPSLPAHNEGFEGNESVSKTFLTDDSLMRRIDGDGFIYDTAPLTSPQNLIGIPTLTLNLSMDVPDTDIRAALYEVKADGSVIFLTQDWVRARYRTSARRETLVTPNHPDAYLFDHFNFVARTIAPGSVLRLVVVPLGASMYVERNRNAAKPVADQTANDNRIAEVSVLLGPNQSHLALPWGK
jgi:uncharacterized protein